jgi:hypothetical protein
MRWAIPLTLLVLSAAAPARVAGQFGDDFRRGYIPNLNGIWYMEGDPDYPCEIIQRPDGRAQFINEYGERAWGMVFGDWIRVPDWGDQWRGGLRGRVRGNTIYWSNGTHWTR